MKKLLLTLFITLCITFVYAQHPYVQKLDDVAQITFPDTPKLRIANGIKVYLLNNDPVYMAEITDARKSVKDMLTENFNDNLYNGFAEGLSKSGKLIYKKKITFKGLQGMEVVIKAIVNNRVNFRYHQVFYFNKKLVSYGIWSSDSVGIKHPKIQEFFNSFKLNIPNADIRQKNSDDLAYASGSFIGGVVAIGCLLAIIALVVITIVLIAKRINRKKRERVDDDYPTSQY